MKETIYTIPVTEAFETDTECPLCELTSRFEDEIVNYYLGPSLMQPENRIDTNDKGFCARHFELMYGTQANRLGLGLMLDTYMDEQKGRLQKKSGKAENLLKYLEAHEKECCICEKLEYTMDRYVEVVFYLWSHEEDFRKKFSSGKGFCMPHFKLLLAGAVQHLGKGKRGDFTDVLIRMQMDNLDRIEKEVDWFTKKFDYRYKDEPWGNSKDALIRGIKKMTGSLNIK